MNFKPPSPPLPSTPLPPPTGVHSVLVALLSEKADVQYSPETTDPDQLAAAIRDLGFGAELLDSCEEYQQGKLDLIVSGEGVRV